MNINFVYILLVILVLFWLFEFFEKEKFEMIDNNIYQNLNSNKSNKYFIYTSPTYFAEIEPDYQAYLNNVSGYDGATRSYNNPLYAQKIARELDE